MVDSWSATVPGVAKRHNLVNKNSIEFNSYAYHHTLPNPQKALKIKLGKFSQKLNKTDSQTKRTDMFSLPKQEEMEEGRIGSLGLTDANYYINI